MTYSFVMACGIALRFRNRETQATERVASERYVWAFLVFSFLTALSLMKQLHDSMTYGLGAVTLIILIRLCFVE